MPYFGRVMCKTDLRIGPKGALIRLILVELCVKLTSESTLRSALIGLILVELCVKLT